MKKKKNTVRYGISSRVLEAAFAALNILGVRCHQCDADSAKGSATELASAFGSQYPGNNHEINSISSLF